MILLNIHIGKEGSHVTLTCRFRILGLLFFINVAKLPVPFMDYRLKACGQYWTNILIEMVFDV
jgi:hypothetical protein